MVGTGPAAALSDYLIDSFRIFQEIVEPKPDFVPEQSVYMLGVISQAYSDAGKPSEAIELARKGAPKP
jgi:hypothetical protein